MTSSRATMQIAAAGTICFGMSLCAVPASKANATVPANASSSNDGSGDEFLTRSLNKEFESLTPGERLAIKARAKTVYRDKRLNKLVVCGDPGNMPFSNDELEGFENKIAQVLGDATGAQISYYWRPAYERGITRGTVGRQMCDMMLNIPVDYASMLTTEPIYRTTYVLASRSDREIEIDSFDDPELKKLEIGVYQTSGLRRVLAKHGIFANVSIHTVSRGGNLDAKQQPWYQVQKVVNGELDLAGVWGPFAGWVKSKGEPISIQPVNLWEDRIPLEFPLAIGVRKTDALLKYVLEYALQDRKDEIEAILRDYGVPLVECSRCYVPGDLPSHGSYIKVAGPETSSDSETQDSERLQQLKKRLNTGTDLIKEVSNAIIARDSARVKLLARTGADLNQTDSQGYTALTSAARQRYTDLVKLLVELGADVNKPDSYGMTPLIHAMHRGDVASIKMLLEHGADPEKPGPRNLLPLAMALEEKRYEAAEVLIENGADVDSRASNEELTPLMIVAAQTEPAEGTIFLPSSIRPVDVAKLLLEQGADVNAKSKNGMTPLMIAASHNNAPMIGLLLDSGANPDLKNDRGQTAQQVAVLNDNKEAAQAIRVLGAGFHREGSHSGG